MKKFISILVSLAMVFTMCATAVAADNHDESLCCLADTTIQVSETANENGAIVITYDNIDGFIDLAQTNFPELDDYEIAKFIIEYSGQNVEAIPECEILEVLSYESLSITESYVVVSEDGTTTTSNYGIMPMIDEWTSPDGYMKITTSYGKTGSSGNETYYNIAALAEWLIFPAVRKSDALALGSTAIFNDAVEERGYVNQSLKCRTCNQYSNYFRTVTRDNTVYDDVTMTYASYTPAITFTPHEAICKYCSNVTITDESYIRAYIKYGIIVTGKANLQARYGHKTWGLSDIGVSIGLDGIPSFSITGGHVESYDARPVTIN